MKHKKNLLFMTILSISFIPSLIYASSYAINSKAATSKCSIRTAPNEGGNYLVPGKIHWLDPGDIVILIDGVQPVKSTVSSCSSSYYYVTYSGNKGYVCGDYITFENSGKYYQELKDKGFSDSYISSLNSLKEQHPNWNFEAMKTGLDFNETVKAQSFVGKSYIQVTDPNGEDKVLLSLDGGSYNPETKTFIEKESGGWYAANKATVAYYLDVRNFLNDRDIYMFEKNTYNSANQTVDAVNTIFKNTDLTNYTSDYIEASTSNGNNISPTALAARSRLEVVISGGALSNSANGKNGYYNFYNIGAYSSCINPVLCGNDFAAGKGWTTPKSAILGGASMINDQYVVPGQDTFYTQKFNVTSNNTYGHQYMTNIVAPKTEANYLYKGYVGANTLNETTTFVIPIYENMPSTISPLPTSMNQDDLNNANNSVNNGQNEANNSIGIDTIVNGAGFQYGEEYITKVNPNTKAGDMINSLKGISSSAGITITSNGNNIDGDTNVGTGDIVIINNGSTVKELKVITYGDASGDGEITILDLLKVQKHILGSVNLSDAHFKAADANKDGSVTVSDLLKIQKYLLGSDNIEQ